MKRCSTCGLVLALDQFHRNRRRADGRQTVCKACKRDYNRRYYAAAPDRHREARQRHLHATRLRVDSIIRDAKSAPCADCGRTLHPDAMDLDHVRGAKRADGTGMRRLGVPGVVAEIAKCDVVCANCHRRRTRHRRIRRGRIASAGWVHATSGDR